MWTLFWFLIVALIAIGFWIIWKAGAIDGTKARQALESAKEAVEQKIDDLTHKK